MTLNSLTTALLILFFAASAPVLAQQTDADLYRSLYDKGEYEKAGVVLKRVTKKNPGDGNAWYYLGRTHLAADRTKEALRAFGKAAELMPGDARVHTGLAYSYLLRNEPKASEEASAALKIDPKSAEAQYILGVVSLRNGIYSAAYERAKKALELNPSFAGAYLLRSQALVSSFAQQNGTIIRPSDRRGELLNEAVEDLAKYITMAPKGGDRDLYSDYLESLKFFAEYYSRPENQKPVNLDAPPVENANITPLKVLAKPKVDYTEKARTANVSGTVRVLAGCSTDGKVRHVLVVRSLGYGLDEQAVDAARHIRFEPKKVDGKPVATVITLDYGFTIY
jgi:TonB family protein